MRVWIFTAAVSATIMFILSYAWHGLVLTDIEKLNVPLTYYLSVSAIIYLLIAFLLIMIIYKIRKMNLSRHIGLYVGIAVGIVLYTLAITQNLAFHSQQFEHIVLDYFWQMTEQGIGGLVAARALSFFGAWKKSF